MNQPQYSLAIKNEYSSCTAFVNDVPALANPKGYALNSSVPINHLVRTGKNTFRVTASILEQSPEAESYFECIAEILVKDASEPMSALRPFARIDMRQVFQGKVLEMPRNMPMAGVFEIPERFSDGPCESAVDMTEDKSRFVRLATEELRQLHTAFRNGDVDTIMRAFASREAHLSRRYYEFGSEGLEQTKADVQDTLANTDFELQELDFITYLPVFRNDGRLLSFENADTRQILHFINRKENARREYSLFLTSSDNKSVQVAL